MSKMPDAGTWEKGIYTHIISPSLPIASHFHPNVISLTGFGMSLLSLKMTYEKKYLAGALLGIGRTYLDWLDGPVARCTNRLSKLGDWLDHVSDWFYYISTSIVLYSQLETTKEKRVFIGLLGLVCVFVASYFGCSEKYHSSKSESLGWLKNMCISEKHLEMLKRFNVNDFWVLLYLFATMLYLHKKPSLEPG